MSSCSNKAPNVLVQSCVETWYSLRRSTCAGLNLTSLLDVFGSSYEIVFYNGDAVTSEKPPLEVLRWSIVVDVLLVIMVFLVHGGELARLVAVLRAHHIRKLKEA